MSALSPPLCSFLQSCAWELSNHATRLCERQRCGFRTVGVNVALLSSWGIRLMAAPWKQVNALLAGDCMQLSYMLTDFTDPTASLLTSCCYSIILSGSAASSSPNPEISPWQQAQQWSKAAELVIGISGLKRELCNLAKRGESRVHHPPTVDDEADCTIHAVS